MLSACFIARCRQALRTPAALAWAGDLAKLPAQSVLAVKRSVYLNRDRDVVAGTEAPNSQISTWVHQGPDAPGGT